MVPQIGDSSQNVDVLAGQGLVHTAHSAELAAHRAGIIVLGRTVVPDSTGSVRINGAGPLGFPVQLAAGVAHLVVNVPGALYALGNVGGSECG